MAAEAKAGTPEQLSLAVLERDELAEQLASLKKVALAQFPHTLASHRVVGWSEGAGGVQGVHGAGGPALRGGPGDHRPAPGPRLLPLLSRVNSDWIQEELLTLRKVAKESDETQTEVKEGVPEEEEKENIARASVSASIPAIRVCRPSKATSYSLRLQSPVTVMNSCFQFRNRGGYGIEPRFPLLNNLHESVPSVKLNPGICTAPLLHGLIHCVLVMTAELSGLRVA